MTELPVLFGYHASNIGNSHVPISLCRFWAQSGRSVSLTVPGTDKGIEFPWLKPVLKGLGKTCMYRFGGKQRPRLMAERRFCRSEAGAATVYLWAGLSLEVFRHFEARGVRIILERINCHRATSARVLSEASGHWGRKPVEPFSEKELEEENLKLSLADAIFCPSPMVVRSMLENEVPAEKLMPSSYGWEPDRFPYAMAEEQRRSPRPVVFLFAGTICLRKGILLLLEAWKRAGINGELVLCGAVHSDVKAEVERHLHYGTVRHRNFTRDIGSIYRMADVFVFPSLEEGGPMVTYEAMAHGIPPIVTAMGGGAIVRDGIDGMVLPDLDVDAWATAMTNLAEDQAKRRTLGENARMQALRFTWEKVAERRAALLENRYPELWKRTQRC